MPYPVAAVRGHGVGPSFSPLSYSPSAWYFAESLFTTSGGSTAPSALNDPVGQATDLSGNGRHCIQATAGSRPVYDPTGINSRPAIKWPATRFLSTGVLGAELAQPNTTFVVFRNADSTTQTNIYDGAASGGRNLLWSNGSGLQFGAYAGGAVYDYARAEPGVYLYCVQYNGASSIIRRNGAVVKTGINLSTQGAKGYTLGTDNAGTGSPFNGWVREFISFNSALSTAQIEQVEQFLAARSGITLYTQATNGTYGGLTYQALIANVPANRWLIYFHGRSENPAPTSWLAEAFNVGLYQACLAAGWNIAYTNTTSTSGWGNAAEQAEQSAFVSYLLGRETVTRLGFIGRSMGALSAGSLVNTNFTSNGSLRAVSGAFFIYPCFDQQVEYTDNAGYRAEILTAFGTDAAGLSAASASYAPLRLPAANFAARNVLFVASAGDTVVLKANNTDPMAAYIDAVAAENDVIAATGNHGDVSHVDATNVLVPLVAMLGRMAS